MEKKVEKIVEITEVLIGSNPAIKRAIENAAKEIKNGGDPRLYLGGVFFFGMKVSQEEPEAAKELIESMDKFLDGTPPAPDAEKGKQCEPEKH